MQSINAKKTAKMQSAKRKMQNAMLTTIEFIYIDVNDKRYAKRKKKKQQYNNKNEQKKKASLKRPFVSDLCIDLD